MNRIFDFVKVWHANTRKLPGAFNISSLGSIIFMALAMVITFGSVVLTQPAQAAPASTTEIGLILKASKIKGNSTICVGDNVPIFVEVLRVEIGGVNWGIGQAIPGVRVVTSMSNGSVGTLNPTTKRTGWDSNNPGGIDFQFHADEPGLTSITFKGTINHKWWGSYIGLSPDRKDFVLDQVEIEVEDCIYKVTTISTFSAPGAKLVAVMLDAGLKRNDDLSLTGTATVLWKGGPVSMFGCDGTMEVAPNQAELVGAKDDKHLTLDITFLVTTLTHEYDCKPGSISIRPSEIPDPVTVTLPASGGAIFGKVQNLLCVSINCSDWNFPGLITVVVTQAVQK